MTESENPETTIIPGPKILDQMNDADRRHIERLARNIRDGLATHAKASEPQDTVTIQLDSSFGAPNFLVKQELAKMCRDAGWIGVEFKTREIESDLCNWIYEVILTRESAETDDQEDPSTPLSRKENRYAFVRRREWGAEGVIAQALREEIRAAVESWLRKEVAGQKITPLILIKRLEIYCQRIMDGETDQEPVDRADLLALEQIIRATGWTDKMILRYVVEPYPLVEFQIESAGAQRWITFYERNTRRLKH